MFEVPIAGAVELSDRERELFALLEPGERTPFGRPNRDWSAMSDAAAELTSSLLERDAVPAIRLQWFDDPELNIGGRGLSRHDVFVGNGNTRDDMIRHPHFAKVLRYFVLGPDLPRDVIEGFRQIVVDDCGTSGEVMDQLHAYARKQARRLKTPSRYDLHEEFHKLALECGVDVYVASTVRKAVQSVR